MSEEELLKDLQRRMDGAIEALRKELGGLRTGRASTVACTSPTNGNSSASSPDTQPSSSWRSSITRHRSTAAARRSAAR